MSIDTPFREFLIDLDTFIFAFTSELKGSLGGSTPLGIAAVAVKKTHMVCTLGHKTAFKGTAFDSNLQ